MRKIVFLGTPDYAALILEGLIKRAFDVALVITNEDKPVGRKQIMTAPSVKITAQKYALDLLQPRKLDDAYDRIEAAKPEFIIVAAYGQIVSKRILAIAPCLNLHASLLPKYRGASPIQAALSQGDRFSGLTVMRMNEGLDTGDMLGFCVVAIGDHNAQTLTLRLAELGSKLLSAALERFDRLNPIAQRNAESSYAKRIKKHDGLIDFDRSSDEFDRAYRAYCGWPNICLRSGLIVLNAQKTDMRGKAGEILAIDNKSAVIGCKEGAVKINQVCPQGKNAMSMRDYLNGKRLGVGDTLY